MEIELLIETGTKVYNYVPSSSGNTTVGSLKRIDNQQGFALDLYPDEKINLTYQIAEVRDPSKKTTSFSKSFYIPGTARNNLAMGYAYNPLVDDAWRVGTTEADTVAQEYKVLFRNAFLTVNGVQSFTGTLEILSAKTQNGNIVSYQVFFLASENTLLDLWDQVQLPELNFGSQYPAITGSPNNMRAAMDNTDADATFTVGGAGSYKGFTFGYPDWGFPDAPLISAATGAFPYVGYNPSELTTIWQDSSTPPSDERQCGLRFGYNVLPYQYLKSLVDKMFELAGYSYESTFFNSVDFRQMLLLYYDKNKIGSNMFMKLAATCPGNEVDRTVFDYERFPDHNGIAVVNHTMKGNYNNEAVPAEITFESGKCEDRYGVYIGNGTFRFPTPGTWTIRMKAWPGVQFGWDQDIFPGSSSCIDPNFYPHSTYPLLGTNTAMWFSNPDRGLNLFQVMNGGSRNPATDKYNGQYTKNASNHYQWEYREDHWNTPLTFNITTIGENEEWNLFASFDATNYYAAPVASPCTAFPINERKYRPFCDFVIEDISLLYPNWSQTVPDISCKQFFNDLVSHFNLFVQINPNERKVIIDDRDNFFTNGEIQDWSSKIDLLQDREIQNYTPNKTVTFTFENSDNWLDKDFRAQSSNIDGLSYGSYKLINNYGDGELEVKSPFSAPTVYYAKYWELDTSGGFQILVENGQNIQYPSTVGGDTVYTNIPVLSLYPKDDNGRQQTEQSDIFIAYNNGFVDNPVRFQEGATATAVYAPISTLTSTAVLTEPGGTRAAHVISHMSKFTGTPASPAQVQLYGNTPTSQVSGGYVPTGFKEANQNTMYNKYWENFLTNQQDVKIYKLKAYLTNRDISLFQFRNPIFLDLNGDGQYYIVNKIEIDPTSNGAATLELYTFNPLYFDFDVDNTIPEYPYEPTFPTE